MPDIGNFQCVLQPFGICSKESNAMKSDNPKSGFYEAKTSRTLDANGGNPSCNQGGIAIVCVDQGGGKSSCSISEGVAPTLACTHGGEPVIAIEGNGSRPSHRGSGYSEDGVGFTLNAVEHHAVAYGLDRAAFNQGKNAQFGFAVEKELEPTIVAKDPNAVLDPYYIVRRLTPVECARLQGFPDWWCYGIADGDPSESEVAFWREVFDTFARVTGGKPKTDNNIVKWLQAPHSDSAEYKMWGNGVALPNVYYVLSGIAYWDGVEDEEPIKISEWSGEQIEGQLSLEL